MDENRELRRKKDRCSLCGNTEWIRKVEKFSVFRICKECGLEEYVERLSIHKGITSVTGKDQWNGVIDNIERLLEDRVSKVGWII